MRTAMYLFRVASILVLLATALTVSGASASGGTPISGEETIYFAAGTDYREWSSGRWLHEKYARGTGTFAFIGDGVSLSGTVSRRDIVKADADGNGRVQGVITYTYVDKGTEVTCQGPSKGVLTEWEIAGSVLAHCSDGSTLHGSIQGTGVAMDGNTVVGIVDAFSGTLASPGR